MILVLYNPVSLIVFRCHFLLFRYTVVHDAVTKVTTRHFQTPITTSLVFWNTFLLGVLYLRKFYRWTLLHKTQLVNSHNSILLNFSLSLQKTLHTTFFSCYCCFWMNRCSYRQIIHPQVMKYRSTVD